MEVCGHGAHSPHHSFSTAMEVNTAMSGWKANLDTMWYKEEEPKVCPVDTMILKKTHHWPLRNPVNLKTYSLWNNQENTYMDTSKESQPVPRTRFSFWALHSELIPLKNKLTRIDDMLGPPCRDYPCLCCHLTHKGGSWGQLLSITPPHTHTSHSPSRQCRVSSKLWELH